jgi:hypothetical protein
MIGRWRTGNIRGYETASDALTFPGDAIHRSPKANCSPEADIVAHRHRGRRSECDAIRSGQLRPLARGVPRVKYSGSTVLPSILSMLQAGRTSGTGLTSSLVPSSINYALGVTDDTANHQVVVRYTIYGDANPDGIVDIKDLYIVTVNWMGSGKYWGQGDFSFDGPGQ